MELDQLSIDSVTSEHKAYPISRRNSMIFDIFEDNLKVSLILHSFCILLGQKKIKIGGIAYNYTGELDKQFKACGEG